MSAKSPGGWLVRPQSGGDGGKSPTLPEERPLFARRTELLRSKPLLVPRENAPHDVPRLAGWLLTERLASSPRTALWRAQSTQDGRRGVVKVFGLMDADPDKQARRVERVATASQCHRGLAEVLQLRLTAPADGHDSRLAGLPSQRAARVTLEYPGGSLADWLASRHKPVEADRVACWMRQAAEALAALHQRRLCHGRLHLGNVLLTAKADNPTARVVLTDFGEYLLAAGPADDPLAWPAVEGFAPPERPVSGVASRQVKAAGDIYALGAIAWVLLTAAVSRAANPDYGLAPHADPRSREPALSLTNLRPDLDPLLAAVIDTCLAPHPSQRMKRAENIVEALRAWC